MLLKTVMNDIPEIICLMKLAHPLGEAKVLLCLNKIDHLLACCWMIFKWPYSHGMNLLDIKIPVEIISRFNLPDRGTPFCIFQCRMQATANFT